MKSIGITFLALVLLFVEPLVAQDTLNVQRFRELAFMSQRFLNTDLDSMHWAADEVLALTSDYPDSKEYAISWVILGEYQNRVSQYDSAMACFEIAIEAYRRAGDDQGAARCILRMAQNLEWRDKTQEALNMHERAMEALVAIGDSAGIATEHSSVGYIYQKQGQFDKSLDHYLQSMKICEQMGDSHGVAFAYNAMGLTHRSIGNVEEEIEAFEKAYKYCVAGSDSIMLGIASCNLGSTYMHHGDAEEGIRLMRDSERLFKRMKHWTTLMSTYSGYIYYYDQVVEGQRDKAIEYAMESVELAKKTNNQIGQSDAGFLLGRLYYKEGKLREAITVLKKALEIAETGQYLNEARKITELLSQIFESTGNTSEELRYLKQYHALNDSIMSEEKLSEIKELELTYEFEQERLADSLRVIGEKQELAMAHQQELASERQGKNLLIFAAILLVLIGVFLFVIYSRSRKQSQVLNEKNEVIEEALHEKNLLLKEVHHRVKNNFQIVSSLLELQSKDIEDDKARELAEEGKNRVKSMALIHQRLYQNDDLLIYFDDYIDKLVQEISDMYGSEEDTKISLNIPKVSFDIDTAIPLGLIINELVTNAFKYGLSPDDKQLKISIDRPDEQTYQLVVSDNGSGLPEGFDISKAKSLGLRLVRRLAKQLQGTVTYSFQEGSSFSVLFKDTATREAI